MVVLVTGAAGQDGRLLIANLKNEGHKVIAVTRTEITCIEGFRETTLGANHGLEDKDFCHSILSEFRPEFIFHFAAVHGSSKSGINNSPNLLSAMRACHITTTLNFLEWMKDNSLAPKLIYPLTSQMYEALDFPTKIDHLSPLKPSNLYAETKLEAWSLIKEYRANYGLWISCPILFRHTSEFAKPEFLFPTLANRLFQAIQLSDFRIDVHDSVSTISMCAASEVVNALCKIAGLDTGQDLVIGDEIGFTISNLLQSFIEEIMDLDWETFSICTEIKTPMPYLIPDLTEAKLQLDWQPRISHLELFGQIFSNIFTQPK